MARDDARRRPSTGDDRAAARSGPGVPAPPDTRRDAGGQPRGGDRGATTTADRAPHALARRGRATRRRRQRDVSPGDARPRARRAPLRRGPSRLGGCRSRQGGCRSRGSHRARDGQGRQGAARPARAARYRGAPSLHGARAPAPRPSPPRRPVPQRARRGADARGRVPHPAAARPIAPGSSPAASTRICCGIRSPPTSSRAAPTSGASRRCSGTRTSARPSGTRTSRTATGARRTSARTRMRAASASERQTQASQAAPDASSARAVNRSTVSSTGSSRVTWPTLRPALGALP